MKELYSTTPIVTMSMGKLGIISRLSGEIFGSSITFGTISDKVSAPGQIGIKELKNDFLVDFVIRLNACDHIVDEVDIVNVEMKTTYKPVKRYEVEVIKDIIGKTSAPSSISFEICKIVFSNVQKEPVKANPSFFLLSNILNTNPPLLCVSIYYMYLHF